MTVGLRLASRGSRSTLSNLRPWWGTRSAHDRRALLYPIEEGLGDFLPPAALKVAVEYQDGLLSRLNDLVRGTEEENKSITQTVLNTATDPNKTLAFNYASLALNNSFFLDQLKPPPLQGENHQPEISGHLAGAIRRQYDGISQLKSTMSAVAMGMFTNGFVWLVSDKGGKLGVIPTIGPGTLLVRSRTYVGISGGLKFMDDVIAENREKQHEDSISPEERAEELVTGYFSALAEIQDTAPPSQSPTSQPLPPGVNPSSPASGISGNKPPTQIPPHSRSLHISSIRSQYQTDSIYADDPPDISNKPPIVPPKRPLINIGEHLVPLFCISIHEHAWMSAGYGVWGKEAWLKEFWSVVDWGRVSEGYKEVDIGYRHNR